MGTWHKADLHSPQTCSMFNVHSSPQKGPDLCIQAVCLGSSRYSENAFTHVGLPGNGVSQDNPRSSM